MTIPTFGSNVGRHLFGAAAFVFGLITLLWADYYDWLELRHIMNAEAGRIFASAASAAQIVGGIAIQFRRSAPLGAVVLAALYLGFALLCVPQIVAAPQIYNRWGSFFEQLSLATGAAIVYARTSSALATDALSSLGRNLFGVCAASFAIEQAVYLKATATLVPKWIPPSQLFWAVLTTALFALAAAALLANRMALLASQLLTAMLLLFGSIVWLPMVCSRPRNESNWTEGVETFAIAGSAWIVADLLGTIRAGDRRPR